jgi:hypothetical protein
MNIPTSYSLNTVSSYKHEMVQNIEVMCDKFNFEVKAVYKK